MKYQDVAFKSMKIFEQESHNDLSVMIFVPCVRILDPFPILGGWGIQGFRGSEEVRSTRSTPSGVYIAADLPPSTRHHLYMIPIHSEVHTTYW